MAGSEAIVGGGGGAVVGGGGGGTAVAGGTVGTAAVGGGVGTAVVGAGVGRCVVDLPTVGARRLQSAISTLPYAQEKERIIIENKVENKRFIDIVHHRHRDRFFSWS